MRRAILTLATLTSLALPAVADEAAWALLGTVVHEESEAGGVWQVEKTFPAALVKAAPAFQIEGYVSAGPAEARIRTFMLVADPASCPFCGDGGYGPALEVHMARPLPDGSDGDRVRLAGRLELISDPETYQAYRLVGARLLGTD